MTTSTTALLQRLTDGMSDAELALTARGLEEKAAEPTDEEVQAAIAAERERRDAERELKRREETARAQAADFRIRESEAKALKALAVFADSVDENLAARADFRRAVRNGASGIYEPEKVRVRTGRMASNELRTLLGRARAALGATGW